MRRLKAAPSVTLALVGAVAIVVVIAVLVLASRTPNDGQQTSSQVASHINGSLAVPIFDKSWKVSDNSGLIDWSPADNIFLIAQSGTVYSSNGSMLFSFANLNANQSIINARFSPDGSKIAYYHHTSSYQPLSTSPLLIYDLKTRTSRAVQTDANLTGISWGANNTVFYSNASQIVQHDLINGTESIIVNSVENMWPNGFDISHDGSKIVYIYRKLVNPGCPSGPGNDCFADQIVVAPLSSRIEYNATAISHFNQTVSHALEKSPDSNASIILQEPLGPTLTDPRWISNDSAITFSFQPNYLFYYRCNRIMEISNNGIENKTLFDACSGYNVGFNKDSTLVAYSMGSYYEGDLKFGVNPNDVGTYLSLTDLCSKNPCVEPSKTIRTVSGTPSWNWFIFDLTNPKYGNGY